MNETRAEDLSPGHIMEYQPVPCLVFAPEPDLPLAMLRTGIAIADAAAVADIEQGADPFEDDLGTRWLDVRPLIDEREKPPEFIDMNAQAIAWALARGLVLQHPLADFRHLVRIARRPQSPIVFTPRD